MSHGPNICITNAYTVHTIRAWVLYRAGWAVAWYKSADDRTCHSRCPLPLPFRQPRPCVERSTSAGWTGRANWASAALRRPSGAPAPNQPTRIWCCVAEPGPLDHSQWTIY